MCNVHICVVDCHVALGGVAVLLLHVEDERWFGHVEHKALLEFMRPDFEDLRLHPLSTVLA